MFGNSYSGGLADLRALMGLVIFLGIARSIAAFFAFKRRNDYFGYHSLVASLCLEAFGILFTAFINHFVALKPSKTQANGFDLYISAPKEALAFFIVLAVVLVFTSFNIWYVLRRKQLYGVVMILAGSSNSSSSTPTNDSPKNHRICCPSCQTYNSHKARICSSCGEPLVGLKEKQPNAVNVTPEASPKSIETITNRQNKTADIQDTVLNDVEAEVICVDNSPTEIATEPTPTVNNDSKNDILSNDTLPEETALIQDPIVPSVEINDTTITIPEIRFCRKCGKSLTPDSAFCNYCGTEIIKEVTDDEV